MTVPVEKFQYIFSDLVFIGNRAKGRTKTTWYLKCEHCHGEHMFRKTGPKIWHTSCWFSGIEWTITPAEYYVCKPTDFSSVLGEI